jgi:WD40 repeat protein
LQLLRDNLTLWTSDKSFIQLPGKVETLVVLGTNIWALSNGFVCKIVNFNYSVVARECTALEIFHGGVWSFSKGKLMCWDQNKLCTKEILVSDEIFKLVSSYDDQYLIGQSTSKLLLWNQRGDSLPLILLGPGVVLAIRCFSKEVYVSTMNSICVWSLPNGEPVREIKECGVIFMLPFFGMMCTASLYANEVKAWNSIGNLVRTYESKTPVSCLTVCGRFGRTLLGFCQDGTFMTWDIGGSTKTERFTNSCTAMVASEGLLWMGSKEGQIYESNLKVSVIVHKIEM